MLAVTRKTDYALITLAHLAECDTVASAREITDRYHLPLAMVTNILKSLGQAGFVVSERGARGGYRLAMPADRISVLRVMEAMEGPLRLVQCVHEGTVDGAGLCSVEAYCPIRTPIQRLHEVLRKYLENITVADVGYKAGELQFIQPTLVKQ